MDGLLLFIGVCILNSLRQLVEYYFLQGLTKPLLRIPEPYMEQVEDYRHIRGMKNIYSRRKETIERVFADGKKNTECDTHITED